MKTGLTEKIWLIMCLAFEFIYNIPGVPAYGDIKGCIIHGLISVIGTLLSVYIGYIFVIKEYPLKEDQLYGAKK